jgi:hypothetical protein
MKNVIFWDVALYRSCVNRRFGGPYRLHLQGRKIPERGISVNLQSAGRFLCTYSIFYLPDVDVGTEMPTHM